MNRAGRKAYLYPNPQITEKYMPYVRRFLAPADYEPKYVVAVDVAAEDMYCKGFEAHADFCVDHHPSNPGYATQSFIVPEYSSCGEIITEIIEQINGDITPEEATLLYIALSTDTGCFRHGNTDAHSFSTAAKLAEYGADIAEINTQFFKKASAGRIMLESMIFSSMNLYDNGEIAVAKVTLDMLKKAGATANDCDDLADLPARVDSELVAVLIRELEDGVSKVSMRSAEGIDSSRICAFFGGGGHRLAAGCTINASPDRAEKLIVDVIREVRK
jgi:Exopolyphosphatase-related proteins